MPRPSPIRPIVPTLLLAASCLAASAQNAPPAKPSAAIPLPVLPASQPTRIPENTPRQPAGRPAVTAAQVHYADGRLAVVADNSSLNQILRDISRETGIKITGGVADERVFGTYGPADPSRILVTLLDGTGSNMLLIDGTGTGPRELILTPRTGGVTPSGANGNFGQRNGVDESDLPPEQRARRGLGDFNAPQPNNTPAAAPAFGSGQPGQNPAQSSPSQATTADESPAATPPASDTTQQQSPNGVKTPQQIYDQLIKLQQQQQAKPQ